MKNIEKVLSNKIIFEKYKVIKKIGKGSYSTVFLTKNIQNKKYYALKIQPKNHKFASLEKEAYYLFLLKYIGIPKIFSFGKLGQYQILIEELLGKTLEDLFIENKNKSNFIRLKDMIMAGIQILEIIKYIHSQNIIHLDIKPTNFLVGNPNNSIIYIIDFGLAKKYRSSRTGKHIQFTKKNYFNGNLCFSSLNSMKGIEPSRRDDLESIGYMLIFLYTQHLPWDYIKTKNRIHLAKKIYEIKSLISLKMLCEGLPNEMIEYMKYARTLTFEENPNYNYLIKILESMLEEINRVNDLNFSWIGEDLRNNCSKMNIINNRKKKISPFSKIFKDIKSKSAFERKIGNLNQIEHSNTISLNNHKIYSSNEKNNIVTELPITSKTTKYKQCHSEKKRSIPFNLNNNTTNNINNKIYNYECKELKSQKFKTNNNINKRLRLLSNESLKDTKKMTDVQINKKEEIPTTNELNNKYIITPIISNKIINIYSNTKNKKINIKVNQYNNNEKGIYSNNINTFKNLNNSCKNQNYIKKDYSKGYDTKLNIFPEKNRLDLLNKYNEEYENWINNINDINNQTIYSFLCPDIEYKRKFNK